jgi:hypothetical protein
LFSGYAITLDSWGQAYRRGGFLNCGAAAWNTYASIHNTYSAWRNMGGAFASLGDFFQGRRSRSSNGGDGPNPVILVVLLVALALLAGVITTAVIIRRVAAGPLRRTATSSPYPLPQVGEEGRVRGQAPMPTAAAVTLADAEREPILGALRETGWVLGGPKGAAARLGMKRSTLYKKMKKLGISRRE